jgi:hypothetical protein
MRLNTSRGVPCNFFFKRTQETYECTGFSAMSLDEKTLQCIMENGFDIIEYPKFIIEFEDWDETLVEYKETWKQSRVFIKPKKWIRRIYPSSYENHGGWQEITNPDKIPILEIPRYCLVTEPTV